ncbi:HAD family hydrolase [Tamlana sp. s12]|uniref:HAD family hydrolase n=1 Tax=Tamlana sp. s12 TaxID=1630406 RepID=UPI0007FCBC2C|nr:HAD family hydrolase [Tamlana sp. s12]OBQ56174.1 HAD family hydrolase [Tamlana sp. s12]QQY83432.1 HAD family hydrolase [Tamlana sp. s12]
MDKKYKCIIFDCDGVLVDSEPTSIQVLVDIANEYGANIDLNYGMKHFKGSFFTACKQMISDLIQKELPDSLEAEYRDRSFEAFQKKMEPVEGVKDVIEHLNLPFCVASSGPESKIRLNLGLAGLLPFFEGRIFSCYALEKWKPDPAVFLWAAKTMGFKPEDCLVIEDSLSGVKAAKAGGFDVFGFTAHDPDNELKAFTTKTFSKMSDLLAHIED